MVKYEIKREFSEPNLFRIRTNEKEGKGRAYTLKGIYGFVTQQCKETGKLPFELFNISVSFIEPQEINLLEMILEGKSWGKVKQECPYF